jgi:hypothetical protein
MQDTRPLGFLSAIELRERARQHRAMAETATSQQTGEALVRLAERLEEMANSLEKGAASG